MNPSSTFVIENSLFNIQLRYKRCLIRLLPVLWFCKFIRTYQQAGLALIDIPDGLFTGVSGSYAPQL
jgi:hypothetical protein